MGGKLAYRLIRSESTVMLAVADAELLNRRIESSDGVVLDVNEEFFGEKVGTEDDVVRLVGQADMIILVGRRAVDLGTRLGLVAPGSPIEVNGVPYVQVFRSLIA